MSRASALLLLLWVTQALAAPAPFLPRKVPPLTGLENTIWHGSGVVGDTTYRFRPGGQMVYTYGKQTYNTGVWRQEGARIFWEMNGRYCWFEGEFRDGVMHGVARNKPGGRWDLKMSRVETDPSPGGLFDPPFRERK